MPDAARVTISNSWVQERGLANPRLAGDEERRTLRRREGEERLKRDQLRVAARQLPGNWRLDRLLCVDEVHGR
jgi:hypothetical protein